MAEQNEKLAALEAEQQELRLMIQEGVTFDVNLKYKRRKPGFWGWLKPRETVTEKRVFKIEEPTLKTLDRLSAVWVQLEIDETRLTDEDYLRTAKNMAASGAGKLALIVAIAVLGEDYYIATQQKGGYFKFEEDKQALQRLTATFLHALKPSELFTLAVLITNVSNLGDFINSIRLMSATRTSDPTHLIEPQG